MCVEIATQFKQSKFAQLPLGAPSVQRLTGSSFPWSPLSSDCQTTVSLRACRDSYASSEVPWDSANCTHSLPTQ